MFVFYVCVSVPGLSHHNQICHTSHSQVMIDQFVDNP